MNAQTAGALRRSVVVGAAFLMIGGCTSRSSELIVVVPSADGHVGSVSVAGKKGTTTLDSANEAASVSHGGTVKAASLTNDDIQRVFGAALAATPIPLRRFTLYFVEGTDRLESASEGLLPEILADIQRRPICEVEVIGHTDRQAADDYNARLSEGRAAAVRDWLVANGVAEGTVRTTGRGERDPVVMTADGVAEPQNRRVEVTIR